MAIAIARKRRALFVAAAVGLAPPAASQAPGTFTPGPTDAQQYRDAWNPLIDRAKGVIENLPDRALNPASRAAGSFAADRLQQLNDARALGEQLMNNPPTGGPPRPDTQRAARAAPRISRADQEYVAGLSRPDPARCSTRYLLCNGTPAAWANIECGIGTPDPSLPEGWRAIGVVQVQCRPAEGRLIGHIVGIAANDLNDYNGPYKAVQGSYLLYTGQAFSDLCTPCAAAGPVLPFQAPSNRPPPSPQPPNILCIFGNCPR
jgi:hypothetical protein